MNNPRCNLTPEEAEELLRAFPGFLTEEQERRLTEEIFHPYIFYEPDERRRGVRHYLCPSCGWREARKNTERDFFLRTHKEECRCPNCGLQGTLISIGKAQEMKSLYQDCRVLAFHEWKGWLLCECGWASRSFSPEDLMPVPDFAAKRRYAFQPGKRIAWKQDGYKGRLKWVPMKTITEPWSANWMTRNDGTGYALGAEVYRETEMKYCAAEEFWIESQRASLDDPLPLSGLISYFGEYTRHPQMEMLVKLGHTDVIDDLIRGTARSRLLNWRAKTPQKFFRMDKREYKVFRENEGKTRELVGWRESGVPLERWLEMKKVFGDHTGEFLERWGTDPRRDKLMRWFKGQHGGDKWRLWMDLLDAEEKLGADITHDNILMPPELRRRHDEATAQAAEALAGANRKNYAKRLLPVLRKKYAWSDGVLRVSVPVNAKEIQREGKLLRHCVAGYAQRHVEGKTAILFLRWCDDPGTPYMTIEMRGTEIVQIHGYHNDLETVHPWKIHEEFLEEWHRWLRAGSPRNSAGEPVQIIHKEEKTA